jgi:hypothetical protein
LKSLLSPVFVSLKLGALALAAASLTPFAAAQSVYTATQTLQLSTFGGITGVFTGLGDSRDLSVTAGVDLGLPRIFFIRPTLEVRGTYPVDSGNGDREKNVLFGVKIDRRYYRFHPYANILFGRGQIDYSPAYPDPSGLFFYESSTSNVISPGAGVDFDLNSQFAIKADFQYQRYTTPVTASGHLYSKPVTLGVVYRFDFNHPRRRR